MQIDYVTLHEIVAAARAGEASLVPETAGYLVLGIGRAMGGAPLGLEPDHVTLSSEGVVGIEGDKVAVTMRAASGRLRAILVELLEHAHGTLGALERATQPPHGADTVDRFVSAVGRALIPMNRAAAKRALARLSRETARARDLGRLEPTSWLAEAAPTDAAPPTRGQDVRCKPKPEVAPNRGQDVRCKLNAGEAANRGQDVRCKLLAGEQQPESAAKADQEQPRASLYARHSWEDRAAEDDDEEEEVIVAEPTPTFVDDRISLDHEVEVAEQAREALEPGPAMGKTAAAAEPRIEPPVEQPVAAKPDVAPPEEPPRGVFCRDKARVAGPLQACSLPESSLPAAPPPNRAEPAAHADAEPTVAVVAQPVAEPTMAVVAEPTVEVVVAEPAPEPIVEAVVAEPADAAEPPARRSGRPRRRRKKRSKRPQPAPAAAPVERDRVDALLDAFGDGANSDKSIQDAASALMKVLDLNTPAPPSVTLRDAKPAEGPAAERTSQALLRELAELAQAHEPGGAIDRTSWAEPNHAEEPRAPVLLSPRPEDPFEALALAIDDLPPEPAPTWDESDDDEGDRVAAQPEPEPEHEHEHEHEDEHERVSEVTPSGQTMDEGKRPSLDPFFLSEAPRRPRASLLASAGLLVAGLGAVAFLWTRHPEVFSGKHAAAAPIEACSATLKLRDLPSPHEILLRLGSAPFDTPPLPAGVRVELIATAPGFQPARLVIPAGAEWQADGARRSLELRAKLSPGVPTEWPAASAGEVGGVGPAGRVHFSATPLGSELWLVSGAGNTAESTVTVPCGSEAQIMVVNPSRPSERRRLTVEADLVAAAARTGLGELSVAP